MKRKLLLKLLFSVLISLLMVSFGYCIIFKHQKYVEIEVTDYDGHHYHHHLAKFPINPNRHSMRQSVVPLSIQ